MMIWEQNLFLESTQSQRYFNVEFYRWINVDKSTLNQHAYHIDQLRDVISTYINVESKLIVCWVRGILLNIYVFNLMNFTKFCSLLATFVNAQETIQRGLNVVARVIWRHDIEQCETNVEAKLLMSTLKFATFNNVKSTFTISTLSILDNAETMLLFSMSSFITSKQRCEYDNLQKNENSKKNIFELQKKDDSFD